MNKTLKTNDMKFRFNMNEEEKLQWEQYYKNEVLVFTTEFKNNHYVSNFVNGFSNQKFVGTHEQYDAATSVYYKNEGLGRIIGTNSYTLDEWDEMHKPKEAKVKDEKRIKELEALFDAEYKEKMELRKKVIKTKRS